MPAARMTIAVRILVVGLLVLGGVACSQPDEKGSAETGRQGVAIASFGFSESITMAEIYSQAVEAAGIPVQRVTELGSREIVEPALEQGKVDLVPEYLGTALSFLDPGSTGDRASTLDRARNAFASRGSVLLTPTLAQNQNGIVVSRATADRLGLAKISDLQPVANGLVFGGPPECPERPFCLPGLESVYGLRFKEFKALDAGGPLSVGALEGNEVDVALLFTSDGHLDGDQFVLLQDDRGLQPPDNLVPVVRKETVDRFGARLTQAVDRVSSSLHTKDLTELNRRVSIDGVKPARAAADWLRSRGLA